MLLSPSMDLFENMPGAKSPPVYICTEAGKKLTDYQILINTGQYLRSEAVFLKKNECIILNVR